MENVFENMFGESFLFSLLGNGAHISSKFENANFMFSMFSFSNVGNAFRWKRGGYLVIMDNLEARTTSIHVYKKNTFSFHAIAFMFHPLQISWFSFPLFSCKIHIVSALLCAICINCVGKFKNHLTDYYWINY